MFEFSALDCGMENLRCTFRNTGPTDATEIVPIGSTVEAWSLLWTLKLAYGRSCTGPSHAELTRTAHLR